MYYITIALGNNCSFFVNGRALTQAMLVHTSPLAILKFGIPESVTVTERTKSKQESRDDRVADAFR